MEPVGQIDTTNPDSKLISIFKRTHDTPFVYGEVLRAIGYLPADLKEILYGDGVKIVLTPSVLEALPDLATNAPRGYRYYSSYNYCGALYSPKNKTVYVAEQVPYRRDLVASQLQLTATLLHEVGHAIDYAKGASKAEAYLEAYKNDTGHISNSDRSRFDYFTIDNEGGAEEMFAELFAIALCPPKERGESSRGLEQAFPKTYQYVKNIAR
jgi:hypothetical protein